LVDFEFDYVFASSKSSRKTFDESVLSGKGKQAYQTLLKTELFAFGGSDYSGMSSSGERALYVLLKEKNSVAAFSNLIDKATPEGGLYALLGLRKKKCTCFDEEFQKFVNRPELSERVKFSSESPQGKIEIAIPKGSVERGGGGIHFYEKRMDVANNIKAGKFDDSIKRKQKTKKQKSKNYERSSYCISRADGCRKSTEGNFEKHSPR
jgi:hypothetical protein